MRAELPGGDPDKDVEITVHHGILTVHAEKMEQKREGKRSEFLYGSFTRSVQLPKGVKEDDIKASYDRGVLTVTAPSGPVAGHPKKIQIAKVSRPAPAYPGVGRQAARMAWRHDGTNGPVHPLMPDVSWAYGHTALRR